MQSPDRDGTTVLVPHVVSGASSYEPDPDDPRLLYGRVVTGWLSQYKDRTRADYRRVIESFDAWCTEHRIHPMLATRGEIQRWALDLEARGLMMSTQSHYIVVIKSFYRYAHEEEFLAGNPAARVKRPRFDDSQVARSYMSRPEAAKFLAATERMRPRFRDRDRALAHVLVLNGLRVSEVCDLNIETMSHERGHQTIVVAGKGGTIATAPLAPVTYWAIMGYIGDRTYGPVFLGEYGYRICPAIVRRRVNAIANEAGIDKHLSPHSCRRTFITGALDAGIAIRDVQNAARHADPRTTARYDQRRDSLDRHPTYALSGYLSGG
jgi:site-specific recombinase XerD